MINKTDLAAAVGADLSVMERDALRMRDGGPFVFAQVLYDSLLIVPMSFSVYKDLIAKLYSGEAWAWG